MSDRHGIEALDRTLRDFRNRHRIMGGLTVVLSGDFRQILPVVRHGTPADEVNACLKSSTLWASVQSYRLTMNMRVHLYNDTSAEEFSEKLLEIGEGRIFMDEQQTIALNPDFCTRIDSLEDLIDKVYRNFASNCTSNEWLCERSILAPTNDSVDIINNILLDKLPGELFCSKSIDSVTDDEDSVTMSTENLNAIEISGLPPHNLRLKIGAPIILLRNLEAPKLCNGTRLRITRIHNNVIAAVILSGPYKDFEVYIPKLPLIPTDYPIPFKRLQFPVKLAYGMTINKSQGQTFKVIGIDLRKHCFSHGQLYVACSRISSSDNLYILTMNGRTRNVVYQNALRP